jgi:hypothetical protein
VIQEQRQVAALGEIWSVRIEMRTEPLFGDEARCLTQDGSTGAGVQLRMCRDRQGLGAAVRQCPAKLHVAATLRSDGEAKTAEYRNDL